MNSAKRDFTEELKELLERQKPRLLFMTRDVNEVVILHIIDLLDLMKGMHIVLHLFIYLFIYSFIQSIIYIMNRAGLDYNRRR